MTSSDPNPELKVFISQRESTCAECEHELGKQAWIFLKGDPGTANSVALCLACADLDHLLFLPSGDAALTRRSKKYSKLCAVVLKWSRARKRYERQGLLVEETALQKAEQECLDDQAVRERRQEREAGRRAEIDAKFIQKFADRIRELFPQLPPGRDQIIAKHACLKYSGRVGRSASAKELESKAVRLAVIAHVRHEETRYDDLLMQGYSRSEARLEVEGAIAEILAKWEGA